MKRINFLIALLVTTFAYAALSFFAGKNGIWCYSQLLEQKKEIARRTDQIQSINNELRLEFDALSKDKDVIAAYARRLDYVSDGEKLVKITGLKPAFTPIYDTGTALKSIPCTYLSEGLCKIIALIIGILSLIIMILINISRGDIKFGSKTKEKPLVKGIPVYDVLQI